MEHVQGIVDQITKQYNLGVISEMCALDKIASAVLALQDELYYRLEQENVHEPYS